MGKEAIEWDIISQLLQLLVTVNFIPSSLIIFALIIEAIRSSETSVLARATRRHIPEDDILHSLCRGNVISYNIQLRTEVLPIKLPHLEPGTRSNVRRVPKCVRLMRTKRDDGYWPACGAGSNNA
jgi:hypothetical protein